MRAYISLTPNTEPVPFDYQSKLAGTFHKWLGPNQEHGGLSLYSLSWLKGSKKRNDMLTFPDGAEWFISSPDRALIKRVVDGIFNDADVCYGMKVQGITLRETPDFGSEQRFVLNSPVLVKRLEEGQKNETHYTWKQPEANHYMTQTLRCKLEKGGLADKTIEAQFDLSYPGAKTKMVKYRKGTDKDGNIHFISNRANMCPVILKGDPEAIGFAWDVGLGNSTGIGFGALV